MSLLRGLHAHLHEQSRISRRFFRDIIRDAGGVRLLDESVAAVHRWHEQHQTGEPEAFDRMQRIRSREFAHAEAAKMRGLLAAARVLAAESQSTDSRPARFHALQERWPCAARPVLVSTFAASLSRLWQNP